MRKKNIRKIHKASAKAREAHMGMLGALGIKALILIAVLFCVGVAAVYAVDPASAYAMCAVPVIFGTTLAANKNRSFDDTDSGYFNSFGVIASDIIFEGAAVGDNGAGYARPLVGGDNFLGFAYENADNSDGSAGDIPIRVRSKGLTTCAISGAVITDVGASVYATDDNAFAFIGTGGTYIGKVYRFLQSGYVLVEFDADAVDPLGEGRIHETLADNKTFDAEDVSKVFWMTVDAKAVTLPATDVGLGPITIVNGAPFGTVIITLDPNVNDKIKGPNLAGVDDKDLINTKATANRGDRVTVTGNGGDGWWVSELKGTWAAE